MSYDRWARQIRNNVAKYAIKISPTATSTMYERFSFPTISFSFNLSLLISINIEIEIIIPPTPKATYGNARYGISEYDPATILGILAPTELLRFLLAELMKWFLTPSQRGYKYAIPESIFFLKADLPILTTFEGEVLWYFRVRKIEASRNWTAFYDMAFFDVNAFPTTTIENHYDNAYYNTSYYDMIMPFYSEALMRVSDILISCFDFATFDSGMFDYPPNHLPSGITVDIRSTSWKRSTEKITSNLYDNGIYDRAPYSGTTDPYPEIFLLYDNLVAYMPLFDFANFDYDVFYTTVDFDQEVVSDIINQFRQATQPIYQQLLQFTGYDRMVAKYQAHSAFQNRRQWLLRMTLGDQVTSPIILAQYSAFMLEYTYARKFEQLVNAENIIQKYVKLGLDETLLNKVADMTRR